MLLVLPTPLSPISEVTCRQLLHVLVGSCLCVRHQGAKILAVTLD